MCASAIDACRPSENLSESFLKELQEARPADVKRWYSRLSGWLLPPVPILGDIVAVGASALLFVVFASVWFGKAFGEAGLQAGAYLLIAAVMVSALGIPIGAATRWLPVKRANLNAYGGAAVSALGLACIAWFAVDLQSNLQAEVTQNAQVSIARDALANYIARAHSTSVAMPERISDLHLSASKPGVFKATWSEKDWSVVAKKGQQKFDFYIEAPANQASNPKRTGSQFRLGTMYYGTLEPGERSIRLVDDRIISVQASYVSNFKGQAPSKNTKVYALVPRGSNTAASLYVVSDHFQ